jgi:hypothetical protein
MALGPANVRTPADSPGDGAASREELSPHGSGTARIATNSSAASNRLSRRFLRWPNLHTRLDLRRVVTTCPIGLIA